MVGGGAVVLATAGFAYMASNTVPASSAGEASAVVTGYTVSGITYSAEQGWGQPAPDYSVSTVKFIITSDATTAPGNGQPAQIEAAILVSGTWQNLDACTSSSGAWQINGSGQGWQGEVCNVAGGAVLVESITGLDVEANQ
jgi:hypothetical protein